VLLLVAVLGAPGGRTHRGLEDDDADPAQVHR